MQYILTEEEYEDLKDEARSGYTKKQIDITDFEVVD